MADEDLKPGRTNTGKVTTRRWLRQKQKRQRLVQIAKTMTETTEESLKSSERRRSDAGGYCRHPGAMAPPNTTQYLMDCVYRDIKMDAHSIADVVYDEFDSCSESCLYFQQKDFEELFSSNLE